MCIQLTLWSLYYMCYMCQGPKYFFTMQWFDQDYKILSIYNNSLLTTISKNEVYVDLKFEDCFNFEM